MSPRCGKCGGSMKEGFPVDMVHNSARVAQWMEGPPEVWFLNILRTRGKRKLPIESWRCMKCGYLESYARESGARG